MPTSNKSINDRLRKGRADLEAYMYQGGEVESPEEELDPLEEADVVAIDTDAEAAPTTLTVLQPGEEDPPDMYIYAQTDTAGALTVYPPGVPCDTGTTRVALDHLASEVELTEIQTALSGETGSVMGAPTPEDAMAEVY